MEDKGLHFNNNSKIYDDVRPGYPQEVYEIIRKYKKFNSNSKILEVGAGNGIATQEIYKKWKSKIVLIEPGNDLCEILFKKFKNNDDIIIKNDFYENSNFENLFDAIISATAFHWPDLSIKYVKSYELLENDGLLILYWNNYGIENEKIGEEIQDVYNKYNMETNDSKSIYEKQIKKIESRKIEIEDSNLFDVVEHKLIKNVLVYSSEMYIKLLKTYSDHVKYSNKFFKEIEEIVKRNENKIEVRILINLEIAKKKVKKGGHFI